MAKWRIHPTRKTTQSPSELTNNLRDGIRAHIVVVFLMLLVCPLHAAEPSPQPAGASNPSRLSAELLAIVEDLSETLRLSQPVLLGSRDPNGPSCVTIMISSSVNGELPGSPVDLDGGPGTSLSLLLTAGRLHLRSAAADFQWHQTRLRTYIQNRLDQNRPALASAEKTARMTTAFWRQIDAMNSFPADLAPLASVGDQPLPRYCLLVLNDTIKARDLPACKQWAAEVASAAEGLADLHRWLDFLYRNELSALDFQNQVPRLFPLADAAMTGQYSANANMTSLPGGANGLFGIYNFLEIERQAELVFSRGGQMSGIHSPHNQYSPMSVWVSPGARTAFRVLKERMSEANRESLDRAARMPYERTYLVNMLWRAWASGAIDALASTMERFDRLHPNASVDELMDTLNYRGSSTGAAEWPDRFEPALRDAIPAGPDDAAMLLASQKWVSNFYLMPAEYKITLTLREALQTRRLDCMRATDMLAAVYRNAGGAGLGQVLWFSESASHAIAASTVVTTENRLQTSLVDGMMPPMQQPEVWPDAYFAAHPWPAPFEKKNSPYATELHVRGLDTFVFAEGYIARGPNAGTLVRTAIPYLPLRNKSSSEKVFAGPYPK